MKRIMLTVAYDGTNYCGWQVQPNGITVQEVLQNSLEALRWVLEKVEACEEYTKYSNAVRPFTYTYAPGSEVYNSVSTFGKSVLKVASENYLYAPVYSSVLGTIGKGRLWALDYRPESMVVAQNPETVDALLKAEAAMADAKWQDWITEATK